MLRHRSSDGRSTPQMLASASYPHSSQPYCVVQLRCHSVITAINISAHILEYLGAMLFKPSRSGFIRSLLPLDTFKDGFSSPALSGTYPAGLTSGKNPVERLFVRHPSPSSGSSEPDAPPNSFFSSRQRLWIDSLFINLFILFIL